MRASGAGAGEIVSVSCLDGRLEASTHGGAGVVAGVVSDGMVGVVEPGLLNLRARAITASEFVHAIGDAGGAGEARGGGGASTPLKERV